MILHLLCSAGCSIMPMSGPEDHVIKSEITRSGPDYGLVKLTSTVVDILKESAPARSLGRFLIVGRRQASSLGSATP